MFIMRNLHCSVYFRTSTIYYREISDTEKCILKNLHCDVNGAKQNMKSIPACGRVDMRTYLSISQFIVCLGSTWIAFHKFTVCMGKNGINNLISSHYL